MDLKIVEKFFANQADPHETREVLEWFETAEGVKYLQRRLEVDSALMNRRELRSMVTGLDSDKLYGSIQKEIRRRDNRFFLNRIDWVGYAFKAAAAIFVILTASLFTIEQERIEASQITQQEPVVFQSGDEQHKEITLKDGSVVRLNSNSRMVVSEDYMQGTREISLTGEAYFDVEHNPEQPFIIHANHSTIEVLGTAFNVRTLDGKDNVQVAVVDGKVSFTASKVDNLEDRAVILSKDQYGYMDINERSILVDELAVRNYLAWKNGRLFFDNHNLNQVCTQLNRLYEVECSFEDEKISRLQLTADFSNDSLEKALSVIALTLKIKYHRDGEQVLWTNKNDQMDLINETLSIEQS